MHQLKELGKLSPKRGVIKLVRMQEIFTYGDWTGGLQL